MRARARVAVAVEGKACGASVLGWGLDRLRAAAMETLRWPAPDLAAAENGDLHRAGIASGALYLFRANVRSGDAVAVASTKFSELVEHSKGLAVAVRERAPEAWATYGGILDAAKELAGAGVRLVAPGKPKDWKGMSYVTLQSAHRKAWASTRPTGQLVFSAASTEWTIDGDFASSAGITPQEIDGYSSLAFPESICHEGRIRVKQLLVGAARAHL